MVSLAWGVHFVLLLGMAAADMELDVAVGVVRFNSRDVLQDAVSVGYAAGASCSAAVAEVKLNMVAGVVRFVVRDCLQVATRVGRTPSSFCRRGYG